jgi:hypothetical protein
MDDTRDALKKLAYRMWEDLALPFGSPEVDWFRAETELGQASRALDLSETTGETYCHTITQGISPPRTNYRSRR